MSLPINCAICMRDYIDGDVKYILQAVTIANGNAMCSTHFGKYHKAINPSGGGVALSMLNQFDTEQVQQ